MLSRTDVLEPLRQAIRAMQAQRQSSGEDCFLVVEEPAPAFFQLHSAVEQLHSVMANPRSGKQVGNDSFIRFVQVGFGEKTMLLEIPNTTISLSETEILFTSRSGFAHEVAPLGEPNSFNPVQKIYRNDQERQLIEDIAYIFFELWRHPIGIALKLTV